MTEADTLHDDDADGGGLGKFRMALLRLGCRVNMEAPAAVRSAACDSFKAKAERLKCAADSQESCCGRIARVHSEAKGVELKLRWRARGDPGWHRSACAVCPLSAECMNSLS